MLNSLRSFAGSPLGIVVFAALIFGLLFFGLGGFGTTGGVATVGRQEISQQEFVDAYNNQIQQYGVFMTPARAVQLQIPQQVLGTLVQLAAIREQTEAMGLGITDEAVATAVAATPTFQDGGQFQVQLLDNYLFSTGMTRGELLDIFREGLLRNQLFFSVRGGNPFMPESYQRILERYYGEQRAIEYAVLAPDILEPGPDPTEEELQTYFQENAAEWRAAELRSVVLLELSPRVLADPTTVTDEEVATAYEARLRETETRHVWQQVFPNQAAADAVAAQIAAGQTYDQLLAAGAIAPNDLGVVGPAGLFDRAVADAAFAMQAGEMRVVAGRAGATLVYVSEIVPGDIPPLAEAAAGIRQEIAEGRTRGRIDELADEIEEVRDTGAGLAAVGLALGLPTRTVAFDANGNDVFGDPVPDLPGDAAFLTRVLDTDVGVATSPINLGANGGLVWFEVAEIIPERPLELAEARDRVVAAWRRDNDELRLQALAESVSALLRRGEPTAAITAELGIPFERSELFSRTTTLPAPLGTSSIQAAFDVPLGYVGNVRAADGQALVIQRVAEIVLPDFDPAAELRTETAMVGATIADQFAETYLYGVQLRLPMTVDMALVYRIIGAQ